MDFLSTWHERFPRASAFVRRLSPYQWAAIIFLAATFPKFVFAKQSEWQDSFVDAGRILSNGGHLYQPGHPYVYPPFMAAAAAPFSQLPEPISRSLWFVLNAVALVVCCRSAWRLGGGQQLPGWDSPRREHLIFWLGLGAGGYYLIDSLAHQQTDLVIGALLLRGCLELANGRSLVGGVLLGVAAACKCTPLLFVPFLIWRGRWAAAVVLALTAVGVSHLADLMNHQSNLVEWWNTFIIPTQTGNGVPGVWASEIIYNQSVAGACNRWTQTSWSSTPGGIVVTSASDPLPVSELKLLTRGVQLALALAALVVCWHRPLRGWAPSRQAGMGRLPVECGLVCVLMLLFSPMSSKPHFLIMLLPAWCASRWAVEHRVPLFRLVLAAAILCGLLVNKDLVKARAYTLGLWYGLVTISDLLLGVLSGWMLWRIGASVGETAQTEAPCTLEAGKRAA